MTEALNVPSSSKTEAILADPQAIGPENDVEGETGASDEATEVGNEDEHTEGGGGAFNPVTGEINWDCPCLGGMAHGPCGPQFREAFSCFVYSEDEPKGINCVEKFKSMQDCFREHPDIYAEGDSWFLRAKVRLLIL